MECHLITYFLVYISAKKYQKSVHVCQSYIASQRLERLGDIVQNDTNYCLLYFRYAKKAVEVVWWSDR